MKKADFIFLLAAAAICLVLFFARSQQRTQGSFAVVEVDGELYGRYDLRKEQEIGIGDTNRICIEDGTVRMIEADCPDHLCIHQGRISSRGEMIVCLPNRVSVQIDTPDADGPDENAPDLIAG